MWTCFATMAMKYNSGKMESIYSAQLLEDDKGNFGVVDHYIQHH